MPAAELREAVKALMGQAKDDLAELVSFQTVADPKQFPAVGHGIGVTTHEPPYMIEGEERRIEPGMCFSIEPGVYLPHRFGVRIEDIDVATEDGARRLDNTHREMRIVT